MLTIRYKVSIYCYRRGVGLASSCIRDGCGFDCSLGNFTYLLLFILFSALCFTIQYVIGRYLQEQHFDIGFFLLLIH